MKSVSLKQILFSYILASGCLSVFLLPGVVSSFSGTFSVLVPLISAFFSLGFAFVLFKYAEEYGSLSSFLKHRFNEKAERTARAVLSVWLLFIAEIYTLAFSQRLTSTSFGYIPQKLVVFILILSASLFVFSSFKAVFRSVEIVFIVMCLVFACVFVLSLGSAEIKEILPVKYNSFTALIRSFLFPLGLNGFLVLLFFDAEIKKGDKKSIFAAVISSNALMTLVSAFILCVFGPGLSRKLSFPFFALIGSSDSNMNTEHFESLFSGIWIIISLSFLTVILKLATENFSLSFSRKRVGKEALVIASLLFVLLFSELLPDSKELSRFILGTLMPLGNLIITVIPFSILTLTKRRI